MAGFAFRFTNLCVMSKIGGRCEEVYVETMDLVNTSSKQRHSHLWQILTGE